MTSAFSQVKAQLFQITVEPFKFSQSYCLAAANAVVNSRLDDYPDDSLRDRKETNISLPCLTGCLRF